MKKLCVVLLLLTFACNSDDDSSGGSSIAEKWSLTKFEPGLSDIQNFAVGAIVWDFSNGSALTVTISEDVDAAPILSEGNYTYSTNGSTLNVGTRSLDFNITNNTMVISNGGADGAKVTFTRILDN